MAGVSAPQILNAASLASALIAGAVVAAGDPGQHSFEQTMRLFGWSGPALSLLSLASSAAWAFGAMLIVYAGVSVLLRRFLRA